MGKQIHVVQAFGEILRAIRKDAGITQENLALDAELDRTYISLLERGERQPTIETLFALSRSLGVAPSDVIARVEELLKAK